jgi:hypothetical protein
MAGGPSAAAGAAVSRLPRGRLADQPSYRVVTWPWSGMCPGTWARNSSGVAVSVPDVGPSGLYLDARVNRGSLRQVRMYQLR